MKKINLSSFVILNRFTLFFLLLVAGSANSVSVSVFEQRADCPAPSATMLSSFDGSYAPSFISTRVYQDSVSRYVTGALRWDDDSYFSYFKTARVAGTNEKLGFEIETHFYNFDDSASTGYGPAYALYLGCDPARIFNGSCSGPEASWFRCDFPNCYRDTQALSDTNSKNEYAQPNIAFGMVDASRLTSGFAYVYSSRVISGRGDKSLVKLNFQLTRPKLANSPQLPRTLNMFPCNVPGAGPLLGDIEFISLKTDKIYAPICATIIYKHLGVIRNLQYCPL